MNELSLKKVKKAWSILGAFIHEQEVADKPKIRPLPFAKHLRNDFKNGTVTKPLELRKTPVKKSVVRQGRLTVKEIMER